MNTGIWDLLGIGLPAVTVALLVLISMVQLELGPFARLETPGKWLLTGAFGMGVLAFCLKMIVAVAISTVPERVIAPIVAIYPERTVPDADARAVLPGLTFSGNARQAWMALPETAPAPADNPTTPEKVALGKRLFHETRLSGDGTLACASCHDLAGKAGGDGRATARGIAGQVGPRNTPTVWNAAFQSVLFWDGRARSLEEQAKGPILNPIEMGLSSPAEAERRLAGDPAYRAAFAAAFGDATVSFDRIAMAIAAFERTLITPDAPYDRFVRGETGALSRAQLRGMALFESLGCVTCHAGPAFSDASLLGAGMPLRIFPANPTPYEDKYRLLADRDGARGTWRVPSLRNVALTGPYFHNGAVDDLAEAVRVMATAQLNLALDKAPARGSYWLSAERELHRTEPRSLSPRDVDDIVAFLRALSSERLAVAPRT
ncbi:MAG: cytochrome c peroxidase [Pseudomonadota bacterium]